MRKIKLSSLQLYFALSFLRNPFNFPLIDYRGKTGFFSVPFVFGYCPYRMLGILIINYITPHSLFSSYFCLTGMCCFLSSLAHGGRSFAWPFCLPGVLNLHIIAWLALFIMHHLISNVISQRHLPGVPVWSPVPFSITIMSPSFLIFTVVRRSWDCPYL